MTHFLSAREKFHSNLLGLHVQSGTWITDQRLRMLAAGAFGKSTGTVEAQYRAAEALGLQVRAQAFTLAISDGFIVDRMDGSCLPHDDASTAARNLFPGLEANVMMSAILSRCVAIGALLSLAAAPQYGADVRKLSLKEAVELAISQNHSLRIARLKIVENEQKKAGERASYFPAIKDAANADDSTGVDHLVIPAGTFGRVQGQLVPGNAVNIPQGLHHLLLNEASISQPLTQLIRIHEANRIAAAEVAISRADLKKAENQVAVDVHRLYFAVLTAELQKRAAEEQIAYAKTRAKGEYGGRSRREPASRQRDPGRCGCASGTTSCSHGRSSGKRSEHRAG